MHGICARSFAVEIIRFHYWSFMHAVAKSEYCILTRALHFDVEDLIQ